MSKQDVMKMQTCVLRVNIHCDGCKDKVRKLLKKTEGVYSASIDAEQSKVTVTGLIDPYTLIKKLEKSGKHAELWGGSGGPKNNNNNQQHQFNQNLLNLNHQFKNLQMENVKGGKDNKSQKGHNGKDQQKGGNIQQQLAQLQQQYMKGGAKDLKLPPKEQKTVKFNLPEEDFGPSEDDFDDEFDDEYDSEFDDELDDDEFEEFGHGHGHHHVPSKQAKMGGGGGAHVHQGAKGKGDKKGDGGKGGKGDGKTAKKGSVFDIQGLMKVFGGGKGRGGDGKKGKEGKKNDGKNGGKNKGGGGGGGKNGGKNGSDLLGNGGKNGFNEGSGKKNKGGNGGGNGNGNGNGNGGGGGNFNGGGGKKGGGGGGGGGGGKDDGAYAMNMMQPGFLQEANHGKAIGGGGFVGPMGQMANYPMGQMGNYPMGQMGHIPAVQGLPMNGGYYQGMGPGNPYSQQQYMNMMMNHQAQAQAQAHGNNMYQPMMYARPHAPVGYVPPMPPPASDPFVHMFSDENTDSCSVM